VALFVLTEAREEKLKKPDPRRKIRSAAPEMEKRGEGRGKGVKK
jgi:hypothetical protein